MPGPAENPGKAVLKVAEMEEGDLAMLIVRTADNLRHIRALKEVFPEASQTASMAIEKIMREPVPWSIEG